LTSGVELESRAFLLEPYLRFNTFSVAQPSDTSVLMKSAVLLGSPLMTLVMNSGEIFLQGIGANGPLTQRHRLPISQAGSLSMPGLSFSDARVGNIGGLVVAYVNPSKMQVELKAFTLDFLGKRAVTEVPWDHASWQVSNAQIPVNICLTPDEYLLVTVGHRLKVFSPDRMEIAEFNLNLSGDVRHLHADKDGVWITLVDDHRLLRCDPVVNAAGIVTAPVWREVNVGSQSVSAFSKKFGQGYVLDADQKRVQIIGTDGRLGLSWEGFDELDLGHGKNGGVITTSLEDVFVWDGSGTVVQFKNFKPGLELYDEQ
jgi:hypothetical protein